MQLKNPYPGGIARKVEILLSARALRYYEALAEKEGISTEAAISRILEETAAKKREPEKS